MATLCIILAWFLLAIVAWQWIDALALSDDALLRRWEKRSQDTSAPATWRSSNTITLAIVALVVGRLLGWF